MKKSLLIIIFSLLIINVKAESLSVFLENDFMFDTDMDYTHGTQITYMYDKPYWMFDNIGVSVMQMMYAPNDLSQTEVIENDRPYAGLLGFNLIGEKYKKTHTDNFKLTIGIIGEHSYAGETQSFIHKVLDCSKPKGWDNQLNNELIFNLECRRTFNFAFKLTDWLYFNIQPGVDLQVGTWNNAAEIFTDFRLGNFDNRPINHGITQRKIGVKNFKHWIFVGFAGKNVWHSTQLDGNVFNDNNIHHVESEDFVGEFKYGFGVGYKKLDIQIINILKTKEYTIQDESQKFSVIGITWQF